jgi:glycosyltransferase involved in cell wall biosynthesis
MKRILIFSLAYYPHVGGAEVALKEITDRIGDIEFHMVTLNFGGEAKEERIGNSIVHRIGNGSTYFQKILFIPRAAKAARGMHRTHHFDAFWAMMSYMVFPIALLRMRRIRVPYLITLQEGDPWKHMFSRWFILPFRPLLTYGFKHADAVQSISTFLAGWAKQLGFAGVPVIIGNGVDMMNFLQKHHEKNHTGTILVTASRLVHKNAIDDVIRALAFLPESVRFRIYGIGPEEFKLKQLAEERGVSSRIEWKGYVDHKELPSALAECDIFIRPSRSEGMGNSFIEAMAAGLPVIATQEGGIADFLYDAKRNPDKETTGWAVDHDSPEQIAEAVKDVLDNPEQVARVVANAQKLVEENYDWDTIAEKMKKLFNNIYTSNHFAYDEV